MDTFESETETLMGEEIITLDEPDPETSCVVCLAEFLDPSDLKVHINEVHSGKQKQVQATHRKCHFCDEYFSNLEDYVYHLRNMHLKDLAMCEYCSRVFSNYASLKRHSIKHNNLTAKFKYSCSQCKSCFTSIADLEIHEMDHGDSDGGFYLNDCFPLLSSIINIKADRFIRALNKGEEYSCSICGYSSVVVSLYIQHLRVSNCRSFVCDKCSNVYSNKKQLKRHLMEYISSQSCNKRRCQQCGVLILKMRLADHKKVCTAIKCFTCNIYFPTVSELTKHQSEKHPLAVSLLSCKFCRKEFIGTISLSRHMHKMHVGEEHLYKYVCVYCRYVYKHPKSLFTHFYTGHSDIQPYTCRICNLSFRARKSFTLHIKLKHNSIGFVEFDRNYEVFFADKKSDNPFTPQPIYEPILGATTSKKNDNEAMIKAVDSEKNKELECVNVNYSDFMSATENEGNSIETEKEKSVRNANNSECNDSNTVTNTKQQKVVKKRKRQTKKKAEIIESDISEDEPLVIIKKRVKMMKSTKARLASWNKKKIDVPKPARKEFTCKYCKKYCYTYQNYHHHLSLHKKSLNKQCIKCKEVFKTKDELIQHTNDNHSTSLLTETLKTIRERRKLLKAREENVTSKFQMTIKKCDVETDHEQATITPVTKGMSVKKFIENFTPEGNDNKSKLGTDGSLTIKKVIGQEFVPKIKMEKFKPSDILSTRPKLAMPVKFIQDESNTEVTASISIAHHNATNKMKFDTNIFEDYCENETDNPSIPDVAEEVLLQDEQIEDIKPPKVKNTQILIPKISQDCKNIRIAHLSNEAPYFKIVKLDDLLKEQVSPEKQLTKSDAPVTMSNGMKLVNVNPLAHLLGEKVDKPHVSKYYKTKNFDYKKVLADALTRLESPNNPKLKRNKKKELKSNHLE